MNNQHIRGIDVSSYQGHINWKDVKKYGNHFAMAKSTEGLHYRDPTFPYNWEGMNHAGLVRGTYHFLHPSLDGRSQADFHHAYVRDSGHYCAGDFCVVDVETTDDMTPETVYECVESFVERALQTIAKQVVIYTGNYFWSTIGNPHGGLLTHRPLWIASYGDTKPTPLPGWPVVSFWQYTDKGTVQGVTGPCDLNMFFGTKEQLELTLKWP